MKLPTYSRKSRIVSAAIFSAWLATRAYPLDNQDSWRIIVLRLVHAISATLVLLAPLTAQAWSVRCYDDQTEDKRNCLVIPLGEESLLHFFVGLSSDHRPFVSVGGDKKPGSEEIIRVDGNRPIRWEANGLSPPNAIVEMIHGNSVRYRWTDWPRGKIFDKQKSLNGFAEAYTNAEKQVAAYKH